MAITKDEVKYIANLARLHITDDEISEYSRQLSDILDYAQKISEIDTKNVEPMTHSVPMQNVFRPDESKDSGIQQKILKNAPDRVNDTFRVPKIIEG